MRWAWPILLIGLTASGLAATPDPAPAVAAERSAIVQLSVNGVGHRDAIVVIRGDGEVLVSPDDLTDAGLDVSHVARVWAADRAYVTLGSLAPKVTFELGLDAARLSLTVDPDQLGHAVLDLGQRAPRGIRYADDTSAFINYAPRLYDGEQFEAYGEAGVRVGGALATTAANYNHTGEALRGVSAVTYEDRAHLRRWAAGDGFHGSGDLGGRLLVGGVTLARTYALDPYRSGAPGLGHMGSVDTPATVDVYVNDRLVRSESIPAGTFQLENLPVQTGDGHVRYEVRDVFGRTQRFDTTYYQARRALGRGKTEFEYTLGVPRDDLGKASWGYRDEPVALGWQRVGLTGGLTAGWAVEAGLDHLSGGPTASLALPIGALDLAASGSVTGGRGGVAGSLGYSWISRGLGASTFVRATSDTYSTLALDPAADRHTLDATAALSASLARWATASVQQSVATDRDRGVALGTTAGVGMQLGPATHVRVTGSRTQPQAGTPPIYSAMATLSLDLGGRVFGRIGGTGTQDRSQSADFGLSRSMQASTDVGFSASSTLREGAPARASLTAQAQSQFGRVQASYHRVEGREHLIVEPSGGVAWVKGGGVHLTRPVHQGFAVVEVPDTAGVRVLLNNNVIGATDASGRLFVPDLLPYYANRLSIDDTDLPLNRRVDVVEHLVAPRPRGGAIVRVKVQRARFVRGRLRLVAGASPQSALLYGELVVRYGAGVVASPIGTGGVFELSDLPVGAHHAMVRGARGLRCEADLASPPGQGPIFDVGDVPCRIVAEARKPEDARRARLARQAAIREAARARALARRAARAAHAEKAKARRPRGHRHTKTPAAVASAPAWQAPVRQALQRMRSTRSDLRRGLGIARAAVAAVPEWLARPAPPPAWLTRTRRALRPARARARQVGALLSRIRRAIEHLHPADDPWRPLRARATARLAPARALLQRARRMTDQIRVWFDSMRGER